MDDQTGRQHMYEAKVSKSLTHWSSDQVSPPVVNQKRKHSHPSGSQFPAAFWDNLSEVHLTKRALVELNWRNTLATLNLPTTSSTRPQQPLTRRFFAQLKKDRSQTLIPAVDFLSHCDTLTLNNLKKTARRGGPDLSDVRGVRKPHVVNCQC